MRSHPFSTLLLTIALGIVAGCRDATGPGPVAVPATVPSEAHTEPPLPMDPHSHARPNEVRVFHAELDLTLDFEKRVIAGRATLHLRRIDPKASLWLDTLDLTIAKVTGEDGSARRHELGKRDELLGQPLRVDLKDGDDRVVIHYATSPEARALQWLTKEQTAGGKQPFLYTQGQAILTRSWVPLQDSPGVRMTYAARVRAPQGLRVVMSAGERGTDGAVFTFAMRDRIPPYLIALACGDLAFAPISARCGVFADPSVLAGAKQELGDMETMVQKCEQYFGAYRWGRYDVLIMPPAFPFGGMENPTLTFATPTILVGDKSQVALIAHELAHSWSGNLVTNATWRDFWLNEGFTVFLEQRIMELVFGKERAAMEIATGDAGLRKEIAELPAKDQVLHIDLTGRNPDDAMTAIAYDKGAAFLRRLEAVFGRDAMDRFLSAYFSAHAFQSITTETFLKFLDQHLLQSDPARKKKVDVHAWVFEPGLPKTMPELHPRGFAEVEAFRTAWLATGKMPADAKPGTWITHQWLHFLAGLQSDPDVLRRVDQRFGLASSPNGEIRSAFLTRALELHLFDFVSHTMDFVSQVGRRKLVLPLVKALMSHKDKSGEPHAREILVRYGPRFHFITRRSIEQLVDR